MNGTVTENADRNALLRFLDLMNDLSDIANEYKDLGSATVHHALASKAHEFAAAACLPQQYVSPRTPPIDDAGT